LLISWLLWRAWERERARADALTERLIARDEVLVPLLKDHADTLERMSLLLDRQASSNQAGGR
jgi:hypothetical protein